MPRIALYSAVLWCSVPQESCTVGSVWSEGICSAVCVTERCGWEGAPSGRAGLRGM